jgi:signal transduction histidine kinase
VTTAARKTLAGEVAVEIARELVEPVHAFHERLGLVVDHLERHVATSSGPNPYPWRSLQTLRHDLATCYLAATTLARRLDELERVLDEGDEGVFDLASAVELGLRLAGHHVAPGGGIELVVDLHTTPRVHGNASTLALIVAQLVGACARSAAARSGSALSVRSGQDDQSALLSIADNGVGDPHIDELGELVRSLIAPWGGTIDAASEPGQGCAFEICFSLRMTA